MKRLYDMPIGIRFAIGCACLLSPLISSAGTFVAHDVKVLNPADSILLAGTVSEPAEGTVSAVLVMATGSGLQNRDEEAFGKKPFKVIAEKLSADGFAVLRMDDRGFGESEGAETVANATNDDFKSDVEAGIEYMKALYPGKKIGILGHSEGGTTAIRIAASHPESIDFIITLAAPAWPGDSIVVSQSRALAMAIQGKWDGEATQKNLVEIAKSSLPDIQKRIAMMTVAGEAFGEAAKLPQVQQNMLQQVNAMISPWYVATLRYNPANDIKNIKIPWLALNGAKDLQVLPGNLLTIKQLNPDADTRELPGLNHLFQHCSSGLPQEYAGIIEDISADIPQIISQWLNAEVCK